jgi:predicted transcriptional regulator
MTSMQDIAEELGISKATVSLVLSGKAGNRVSSKMKAEILSKAEDPCIIMLMKSPAVCVQVKP